MSTYNNPYFSQYVEQNGNTYATAQNLGTWESQNGYSCSYQQHGESPDMYQRRLDAYNNANKS